MNNFRVIKTLSRETNALKPNTPPIEGSVLAKLNEIGMNITAAIIISMGLNFERKLIPIKLAPKIKGK